MIHPVFKSQMQSRRMTHCRIYATEVSLLPVKQTIPGITGKPNIYLGEFLKLMLYARYMNYIVHRDDASQSLQYCNDGLQNIIDQCISGGNYWGGEWSLNGFKYSISNSIFDQTPNNPLAPGDAGGPPAPLPSSTTAAPPSDATIVTETVDGSEIAVTVCIIGVI